MVPKTAIAVWIAAVAISWDWADENEGQTISRNGVSVWTSETQFSGKGSFIEEQRWEVVPGERLPLSLQGHPVIGTDRMLCVLESGGTRLAVYSRQPDRLIQRASVRLQSVSPRSQYRLVRNAARDGLGIEVLDNGRLQYTLRVFGSGLMEIKPSEVQRMTITESRLAYAIVPSLIGADLVYDPRRYTERQRLYVPSANLLVGLVDGADCVLVGAWAPGDQLLQLQMTDAGGRRLVDGLSIALAGESFYLQFVEQSAIWHVESLKPGYLEKDTVIGWKRPFEAKWIGRFFVESEDIHYPFYFRYGKLRLWGRYVRSWYDYPLWFEQDKTYIHFEKKFPPQGELLIYCLEGDGSKERIATPVKIMQEALGEETVAELLDFDGIEQRPLLAHHFAVCAMMDQMATVFKAGDEVKQKEFIKKRSNEVVTFIKKIRQRIFEYGDFAREMKKLLQQRGPVYAADRIETLEEIVDEITLAVAEDIPDVPLDEVRRWTDQIKNLAREVQPSNWERFKALDRKCRSVAGSQDELARELSILAIRLMEKTAALGGDSPEQVRIAEQILSRSRQILRHPTWWEPRRYVDPPPNPGAPR